MSGGVELANWIRLKLGHGVTHLKLQKLVFYAYGAAVAHRVQDPLGTIRFRAWQHGPVCKDVWDSYKAHGSAVIEPPGPCAPWDRPDRSYGSATTEVMSDALAVYDLLGAWALREESHLEEPWLAAIRSKTELIDEGDIRVHFRQKFAAGQVQLPAQLRARLPYAPDGLPVVGYASLHELAEQIRAARAAAANYVAPA